MATQSLPSWGPKIRRNHSGYITHAFSENTKSVTEPYAKPLLLPVVEPNLLRGPCHCALQARVEQCGPRVGMGQPHPPQLGHDLADVFGPYCIGSCDLHVHLAHGGQR